MAFVPNARFRKAFSRGDVEPVVKLEIEVPMRQFLQVLDYVQGQGKQVIIYEGTTAVNHVLEDGIDFTSDVSNVATAQSICTAINASAELRGRVVARLDDLDPSIVEVVWFNPVDNRDLILSEDDTAWTVIKKRPYESGCFDVETLTGSGTTCTITVFTWSLTFPSLSLTSASYNFLAGTDFTYSASSKETTAANLAAAINAHGTLGSMMFAYASGRRVWVKAYSVTIREMNLSTDDAAEFSTPSVARRAYTFVTGSRNLFGYRPSLQTFDPPPRSKDVLTNIHSVSEGRAQIIDDGSLRFISKRYLLKGSTCRWHVGTPQLTEADFQPFVPLVVDEMLQDGSGAIEMTFVDILGALRDIQTTIKHAGLHPLESAELLLRTALPAVRVGGVDVAEYWFDFDSFDFTLYTDRSHFVVSRTNNSWATYDTQPLPEEIENQREPFDNRIKEPEPTLDMLNQLLLCADGGLTQNADGRYAFYPMDLAADVDHIWSAGPEDGYDVADIEQKTALESVIADVTVSHANGLVRSTVRSQDAAVAARFTFQVALDSPWINAHSPNGGVRGPGGENVLIPLGVGSPDDSIVIENAERLGFSGTAGHIRGSTTRDSATRELNDTTRPAFFRINSNRRVVDDDGEIGVTDFEIVAIDEARVISDNDMTVPHSEENSLGYNLDFWTLFLYASYTDDELGFGATPGGRGGLGTVRPDEWGTDGSIIERVWITDVTIPMFIGRQRLRRFKFGAPVIECRTNLSKVGVQLGDVVVLYDYELLLGYAMDGTDSNIFWEVTRVQEVLFNSDPGIEIELTFLRREDFEIVSGYAINPDDGQSVSDLALPDSNILIDDDGNEIWIDADGDLIADTPVVI